jgi:CheY-like chemotaxis protein
LQYVEKLLSYQAVDDKQNGGMSNYDNFISSRGYDRAITMRIQSNLYYNNEDINKGDRQIEEKSTVKKTKTILVIDDDKDITLTVRSSFESENDRSTNGIFFQVHTHNFPLLALSEFKPNFYDLLLIDVEMPKMNGFELCTKVLELDPNPKICFMSVADVNYEALREIYPSISFGCFIKKPVSLDYLIKKVRAELE